MFIVCLQHASIIYTFSLGVMSTMEVFYQLRAVGVETEDLTGPLTCSSHGANKGASWDLNPGLSGFQTLLFTLIFSGNVQLALMRSGVPTDS